MSYRRLKIFSIKNLFNQRLAACSVYPELGGLKSKFRRRRCIWQVEIQAGLRVRPICLRDSEVHRVRRGKSPEKVNSRLNNIRFDIYKLYKLIKSKHRRMENTWTRFSTDNGSANFRRLLVSLPDPNLWPEDSWCEHGEKLVDVSMKLLQRQTVSESETVRNSHRNQRREFRSFFDNLKRKGI